jgi:dihydrodipicolinate synthase/N-acetylneuraminate lyase
MTAPSGHHFGVDDLDGLIVLPPTPALPGSERIDAIDTVALEESERMIRSLVSAGVDGIMTNGTLGEAATLTRAEWEAFVATTAETVSAINADFPVFVGVTALHSREIADRIRYVRSVGLHGAFVGRPFWSRLGSDAMIDFYVGLAAEFPDVSFVVYDNPEAFKGPIPPAVYGRLAAVPGIIGAKCTAMTPAFRTTIEAVGDQLRVMPIEADWLAAKTLFPDQITAAWSSSAVCGPEPVLRLRDALRSGDIDTARLLTDRIEWTYETFLARTDFAEFSKYNIPIEKARFDAAGFVKAGPARAPYNVVPDAYLEGARENGRRWRQLVTEVEALRRPS